MATMQQPGSAEPPLSSLSGRRRVRLAIVALSVIAAVAGAAILFANSVSKKATAQSVAATLRVPGEPNAIVAGPDALWAALNVGGAKVGGKLVRLNLATGAIERTLQINGVLGGFAIRVGDSIWVESNGDLTDTKPGALLKVNSRSGTIARRIQFDHPVFGMAFGDGALWVIVGRAPATVVRIDPVSGVPGKPMRVDSHRVIGLAFGEGALWATAYENGMLVRIDPSNGSLRRINVGSDPVGLTVAQGAVWVALRAAGSLVRVDAKTMRIVGNPIPTGGLSTWVATVAGSVWVSNQADGTVVRIDAKTGTTIGTPIQIAPQSATGVPPAAHALSVTGNSLWVASMSQQTVSRVDPSR
jgi:virginiamycin B lyase